MLFKFNKHESWKSDPIFVSFVWLGIITLAPVWAPLHVILRILNRKGFIWKGCSLGLEYWVIELSSEGFKKVDG